ncbi:MAG: hypothetical protein ACTTJC_02040 [Campylobacter sp.]
MNTNKLLMQLEIADLDELKNIVKILIKELNATQENLRELTKAPSYKGIYSNN